MSIYLRTLRYFRAFTGQTLLAVVLMTIGIGFNLLKPWPFKYIVDGILDTSHGTAEARALAHYLLRFPFARDLLGDPELTARLRDLGVYRFEPERAAFTDNTSGVFGRETLELPTQ